MSDDLSDWLGEPTEADVILVERAPGGALSAEGRQAAIEASLAILSLYFSDGEQELVDRSAVSSSPDDRELDELRAGLRLRVAIAAGRRLVQMIESIERRPTFRYELRSVEHASSLNGALDINRWVTRPRGAEDLSYPVFEVQRGMRTPENVLTVYAALWLLNELRTSLSSSLATTQAVEYRAVRTLRDRLNRAIQLPTFAGCTKTARAIRTQSAVKRLISDVNRRLTRREIYASRPYEALADWVDDCLRGRPAVAAGDIDLAMYGDRFDNKLFELWCLRSLGNNLARALNLPDPLVQMGWRRGAPTYSLETFTGRIDMYFQRSISALEGRDSARWTKENGRRLGGIPDIVVMAQSTAGERRVAVIDPKLRQRDRLPSEELYKVLGYLQNFEVVPAIGVVLMYTTSTTAVVPDVFHDNMGGALISVALNPSALPEATIQSMDIVVRTVLGLIDYQVPDPVVNGSGTNVNVSPDEHIEQAIHDVQDSIRLWGRDHPGEIGSSRERLEALVGDTRWSLLDDDVRVMMATADLVGHRLESTADFSGPVIGMCAAIEHILHASVISPVVGTDVVWAKQTRTFGSAIDALDIACRLEGGALHGDIRSYLLVRGIDYNDLSTLLPLWRKLNREFRVPAAHRQVISKARWQEMYRIVIGADSLFIRTFDSLFK